MLDHMFSAFTFPITIETVIGGMVVFISDGFSGYPVVDNPIGCESRPYKKVFYTLVTNPQASVEITNMD